MCFKIKSISKNNYYHIFKHIYLIVSTRPNQFNKKKKKKKEMCDVVF
jgi:hypothetical protein